MGILAGFFGKKIDFIFSQCMDISLAFPSLLLAIGISIVLPAGFFSIVLALSLAGWAPFARLIRSQTLMIKKNDYLLAGIVLGSSSWTRCVKHILPNCLSLMITSATLNMGSFMLAESGLSFLGLGISPPYPTLGGMVSSGRDFLFVSPWIPLIPGFLIGGLVLFCNYLGEWVQKMNDPKRN